MIDRHVLDYITEARMTAQELGSRFKPLASKAARLQ